MTNLTVRLRSILTSKKSLIIQITKINDSFFRTINNYPGCRNQTAKFVQSTSDDGGIAQFKELSAGHYLLKIMKNKTYLERLVELREEESKISIWLPFGFGYRGKKRVDNSLIREIFEKVRTDRTRCFVCKKSYHELNYHCRYCGRFFCGEHRLPENHNCGGKPKSLGGSYREVFSGVKSSVSGK